MDIIKRITDMDIVGYEGMSEAPAKISARAVLFDHDGNIALVYVKKKSAYSIPGGGVKKGERVLVGLEREILEETGCKCEVLMSIGCISENRAQHDFSQLSYYFIARVIGEKGKTQYTQKEIENENEVRWFKPRECEQIIYNQKPINYQFAFIQQRDEAIFRFLNESNSDAAKLYENLVINSVHKLK